MFTKVIAEQLKEYFSSKEELEIFIKENNLIEGIVQEIEIDGVSYTIKLKEDDIELSWEKYLDKFDEAISLLEKDYLDIFIALDIIISFDNLYDYFIYQVYEIPENAITEFEYNYNTYLIIK